MKSYKNFPNLFVKFLLSYLVILIIPLSISIIDYQRTIDVLKNQEIETNLSMLEQIKIIIDRRLDELDSIVEQVANDPDISHFPSVSQPFLGKNIYFVYDIINNLYDYKMYNNFIYEYFIVFRNNKVVLGPQKAYRFDEFMDYYVQFHNLDKLKLYREYLSRYNEKAFIPAQVVYLDPDRKPKRMLAYVRSIGTYMRPTGLVLVLIEEKEILHLFENFHAFSGGYAFIADGSGEIITQYSSESIPIIEFSDFINQKTGYSIQKINGQHMIVLYTTSEFNNWRYFVVQPLENVSKKADFISKTAIVIFAVSTLIGIIIAFYLSYKNTKPIQKMIKVITDKFSRKEINNAKISEYQYIENILLSMFNNNEELERKLDEQRVVMRFAFLDKLFNGSFVDSTEIQAFAEYAGLKIQSKYYIVAVLSFQGYYNVISRDILNELDQKKVLLKQYIANNYEGKIYVQEVSENKVALLILSQDQRRQKIFELLNELIEGLDHILPHGRHINITLCVGPICDNLIDISRSFELAHKIIALKEGKSEGIIWYDQNLSDITYCYYPIELENRLINAAKIGNKEYTRDILKELYTVNFLHKEITSHIGTIFRNNILGTLFRIVDQLNIKESILIKKINEFVADCGHISNIEFDERIVEIFDEICETINLSKKSHNEILVEKIKEKIVKSYGDPSLSIASIANDLHLSEIYLSQLFKEQTGITYSDYLNDIRMEKAKELLGETTEPVKRIAEIVGYNSSTSFCRAFKRINGISPIQYRDSVELHTKK